MGVIKICIIVDWLNSNGRRCRLHAENIQNMITYLVWMIVISMYRTTIMGYMVHWMAYLWILWMGNGFYFVFLFCFYIMLLILSLLRLPPLLVMVIVNVMILVMLLVAVLLLLLLGNLKLVRKLQLNGVNEKERWRCWWERPTMIMMLMMMAFQMK